jgi:cytochrome b561
MLRNSLARYGLVSVFLHWTTALLIIALFVLGLWMVSLDYYHDWYHRAPALHKSIGLLLAALWLVRLCWRCVDCLPAAEANMLVWERRLALWMHRLFYLLVFALLLTGYLIPTAENAGIDFFGLFEVPAIWPIFEQQADVAGWLHWALAWLLMFCALLHTTAALRHHFYHRDRTLLKMLGR